MDIILLLILIFYVSVLVSFVISIAAFSLSTKIKANFWILGLILGIFILNWIKLAL